jgi:pimeloyl-ACP methyl ester carboxylesterase
VLRKLAYATCALALFVVVGLPWLLSFAVTKAGTRCERATSGNWACERERTDTPAAEGAQFEDVSFTSADGNRLSGWYLPASTPRAVQIVMTHGLFRSRYEMLGRGVALWRAGYGVLLYDLRRHGRSAAEFSTVGYDERHDVAAAVRFVRARAPGQPIALLGVSMGAAATLLAAADAAAEPDIIAVVAESSFLSFADTVRHHVALIRLPRGLSLPAFPFATLLIKFTAWRMGFRAEDFDLVRAVRRIRCPVLFIGGGRDQRMPNETVLEPLYAAAAHPLKRKLVVADATHGRAYDTDPAAYTAAVREFLAAAEQAAGARAAGL